MFDVTDRQTYDDIDRFWRVEVESYAEKDVIMYLVGNKADMVEKREVEQEMVEEYAKNKGMHYFECSAKEGDRVQDIFTDFARKMMKREEDKKPKSQNTTLKKEAEKTKEKKCC